MSYAALRGKIREVFGTNQNFSEKMGMDLSTLSAKLNNKSNWKCDEIAKACGLLNIPIEDVHLYFFCKKS